MIERGFWPNCKERQIQGGGQANYIYHFKEREREAAGAGVAPIQKSTSDLHVL
jgi:hypothetical protein